jgi:hypothetical protein
VRRIPSTASNRSTGAREGLGLDANAVKRKSLTKQFYKVQQQLEEAAQKHETLLHDLRKKDASYTRRQNKYLAEIEKFRNRLQSLVLPRPKDDRLLTKIEIMHERILSQIDRLDEAKKVALQEHEADMLAHFRAELADMEPHAQEEAVSGDAEAAGHASWVHKTTGSAKELDKLQEQASRLAHMNRKLRIDKDGIEHARRTKKVSKDLLVAQCVALKKENSSLRHEIQQQQLRVSDAQHRGGMGATREARGGAPRTKGTGVNVERFGQVERRCRPLYHICLVA